MSSLPMIQGDSGPKSKQIYVSVYTSAEFVSGAGLGGSTTVNVDGQNFSCSKGTSGGGRTGSWSTSGYKTVTIE